jgi:hypothetical protein
MLALLCIAAAVLLSLMPDILSIAHGKASFSSGNDSLAWTIIFLIGVGPGAVYNVVQEKFLVRGCRYVLLVCSKREGLFR